MHFCSICTGLGPGIGEEVKPAALSGCKVQDKCVTTLEPDFRNTFQSCFDRPGGQSLPKA